jgi:uncharacterized membrane protein YphA (DoxX/SURF4 family)
MMTLRTQKILHWVFTGIIVGMMLPSAIGLLAQWPQNLEGMLHLGYPPYFLTLLGTAKALGCAALIYPRFRTLTEWAYAGFTFDLLGASYSHYSSGDGIAKTVMPFVVLVFLAGSYHYWKKGLHTPSV